MCPARDLTGQEQDQVAPSQEQKLGEYAQLSCCEQADPTVGIAVGQTGTAHCQPTPLQVQVASPYWQSFSMPAVPADARQRLPSTGRLAGQVHLRVFRIVPQTQV
jgi:hypothetical protein